MIDIIKNLFKSFKKEIPEIVQKELMFHFPDALNVDWYPLEDIYEAVFYIVDVEHIAKISKLGKLFEYKKNLWVSEVPELIKSNCQNEGEIMSAIAIYYGSEINYELIIRDEQLVRNMLLFDKTGKLLKKAFV